MGLICVIAGILFILNIILLRQNYTIKKHINEIEEDKLVLGDYE